MASLTSSKLMNPNLEGKERGRGEGEGRKGREEEGEGREGGRKDGLRSEFRGA